MRYRNRQFLICNRLALLDGNDGHIPKRNSQHTAIAPKNAMHKKPGIVRFDINLIVEPTFCTFPKIPIDSMFDAYGINASTEIENLDESILALNQKRGGK
jgi:hypothetical protein